VHQFLYGFSVAVRYPNFDPMKLPAAFLTGVNSSSELLNSVSKTIPPKMYCYFFSGNQYIRVQRGQTGPGTVNPGYPAPIYPNWGWPTGFAENGIDAALYSGSVCYFFKGPWYVQTTRGITGPGVTTGPYPISNWNWPDGFGAAGTDAALWSGTVTYFFKGNQYIRVTRKYDTDFGNYPRSILAGWGWGAPFDNGVKAALLSGAKCYFFTGTEYIQVSRGFELGGFIDPGYPTDISHWGFPKGFGTNGIDAALYSGGPRGIWTE